MSNMPDYVPNERRKHPQKQDKSEMPLTDEEYLIKYGKTREQAKADKIKKSREYARQYYRDNIKGKTKKAVKKKKEGVAVVKRKKKEVEIPVQPVKTQSAQHTVHMRVTTEDVFSLFQMQMECMEMLRGGIDAWMDRVIRRKNGTG